MKIFLLLYFPFYIVSSIVEATVKNAIVDQLLLFRQNSVSMIDVDLHGSLLLLEYSYIILF